MSLVRLLLAIVVAALVYWLVVALGLPVIVAVIAALLVVAIAAMDGDGRIRRL